MLSCPFYRWRNLRNKEIIWLGPHSWVPLTPLFLTANLMLYPWCYHSCFLSEGIDQYSWNSQVLPQKILLNPSQSGPQRKKEKCTLFCSPRCRESWFQMSSEEYFYRLSAKRCYQWEYSVSRKKSQPMNSLTYRLFREIKTGYHLHCCKDVATSFSYIFEKKNSLRIDTGAFSCPADKQNCKCGLRGGKGAVGPLGPRISEGKGGPP